MRLLHQWLVITIVSLFLAVACGEEAKINESPLVTWDPGRSSGADDATAGIGTLEVSAGCVRLLLDGGKPILLIWPEPTSWNPTTQTIEYVGLTGQRMELRDGDRIRPGGSGPYRGAQYVSPPSPSCRGMETFTAQTIIMVTD